MTSFGRYVKDEILSKLIGPFLFIVACALFFGFVCIIPYIQRLPLFRMDTTDACWFSICMAIYSPLFLTAGFIAFICLAAVGGICYFSLRSIGRIAVLFYKHILIQPFNLFIFFVMMIALLIFGCGCYATYLELDEFLS